jgi:hypothetical protein
MQNEFVLRQDRTKLILCIVLFSPAFIAVISMLIDALGSTSIGPILILIFLSIVFLAILIYCIKELYERKVEISISREGVYLRNLGLYPWSLIESFSTVEDKGADSTTNKLVLHFEKYADEDFDFTNLEIIKDDIVKIMLAYKGSSAVYYAGHKKK